MLEIGNCIVIFGLRAETAPPSLDNEYERIRESHRSVIVGLQVAVGLLFEPEDWKRLRDATDRVFFRKLGYVPKFSTRFSRGNDETAALKAFLDAAESDWSPPQEPL